MRAGHSRKSDECCFCGEKMLLAERMTAEGLAFHRQCFRCAYCARALRLANYVFAKEGASGGGHHFYCEMHALPEQRRNAQPEVTAPAPQQQDVHDGASRTGRGVERSASNTERTSHAVSVCVNLLRVLCI